MRDVNVRFDVLKIWRCVDLFFFDWRFVLIHRNPRRNQIYICSKMNWKFKKKKEMRTGTCKRRFWMQANVLDKLLIVNRSSFKVEFKNYFDYFQLFSKGAKFL